MTIERLDNATLYCCGVMQGLAQIEDDSVQCCVTSPPYWRLRDYGVKGQIGLEPTLDDYIATINRVFLEVRRVLRPDGTLWLNMGDSYSGSGGAGGANHRRLRRSGERQPRKQVDGMKPKNLCGAPWRVAFALQESGWWLRSCIIWHKPCPMPESCKDRPTTAHEYIFLLTKSDSYYYDADAIKEPTSPETHWRGTKAKVPAGWDTGQGAHRDLAGRYEQQSTSKEHTRTTVGPKGKVYTGRRDIDGRHKPRVKNNTSFNEAMRGAPADMRNARTVWTIPPQPMPEAHFATFPEALPAKCIAAGSRRGDVVLDPFLGAGTTAVVAHDLGRRFVGIELSPEYFYNIAVPRIQARQSQLGLEV